jgi:hypothetical protein
MATFSISFSDGGPWMGLWEGADEQAAYCRLRVAIGRKIEPTLLLIHRVFPVSEQVVRTCSDPDPGWLWFLAASKSVSGQWDLCSYQSGGRSFRSRPAPAGIASTRALTHDV